MHIPVNMSKEFMEYVADPEDLIEVKLQHRSEGQFLYLMLNGKVFICIEEIKFQVEMTEEQI